MKWVEEIATCNNGDWVAFLYQRNLLSKIYIFMFALMALDTKG